jgi:hypothetical protein
MDSTSMSEQASFINIDSMRHFIIDYYKTTNSSFQCAEHPFIDYDSNLHRVGVRQFTWHDCIEMFKSNIFLKTLSIEQNKRMIEYFYKKFGSNSNAEIHIDRIPFILDRNNRLQLSKDIYFPTEIVGSSKRTIDSNDLYVHTSIFIWLDDIAPKEIKEWLQILGVTERTDLTYLQKTIIPNAATYITLGNAIKTIKMLFMLFQKNSIAKREFDQLKSMKLLTTRGSLISANQCFFSDQYDPSLKFEEYLQDKEDKFLTFDYVTSTTHRRENEDLAEWRRFFNMLGVQEELRVIEFQQRMTNSQAIEHGFSYVYLRKISPYGRHGIHGYSELQTITFLQHTKSK